MIGKTSIQKQLFAALLLVVFLFIHVVKIMHTHDRKCTVDVSCVTTEVLKSTDCPICDFHFCKESIDVKNEDLVTFHFAFPLFYPPYQVAPSTSIGLNYSDRLEWITINMSLS